MNLSSFNSRGQGTIEYLVIIAVVVVISLVVVGMFSNIGGAASGSIGTGSKALSSKIGSSSGITIVDSAVDSLGNGIVRLANNSSDSFSVTKISAVDASGNRSNVPYKNTFLPSGGNITFSISNLSSYCMCNPGDTIKNCQFEVTFTSSTGIIKTQLTTASINCVSLATGNGSVTYPSPYTPYVWVTTFTNHTATKFNSANGATIGSYSVGFGTTGVAVDASGNVWTTNTNASTVSELSSSGTILGTYSVGSSPQGIAIDSSGNVWIANSLGNTVTKLNSSGSVLGTYAVGNYPDGIAADASGNIWVTNYNDGNISELNSSGTVIGRYLVGFHPLGIAVDSSGNVWVTNSGDANVSELNSSGVLLGRYSVGTTPRGIAIDANGTVWVANAVNTVSKLSSTGALLGTYSVGNNPYGISVDANGNIWVINLTDNTVSELNSAGTVLGTYSASSQPEGFGDMTGFAYQYFVLGRR